MDRLDPNNYCLILTVENENSINNRRIQETQEFDFRYYEKESINCIKSWRNNAGWLKDIEIYILCPTEDIKPETKEQYKFYNVNYINEKPENFKEYEYGFANVHFAGDYFHKLLPNKMLIHIDLDMDILRPLPIEFFNPLWDNKVKAYIGGYQEEDYTSQRPNIISEEILNTDFIVSISNEYNIYEKIIQGMDYISSNYDRLSRYSDEDLRVYDIEEYGADYAYNNDKDNIKLIIGYEQGEGYYYNEKLKNVYFWHEHLKSTKKPHLIRDRLKLMKRLKEMS